MSYDVVMLFDQIQLRVAKRPLVPIEQIARELNVARGTVERAVKTSAGKTCREFRQELVLQRVRSLLTSENPLMSVKEIASAVGYQSPRSFARAVKRACGLSPQELRRQIGVRAALAGSTCPA